MKKSSLNKTIAKTNSKYKKIPKLGDRSLADKSSRLVTWHDQVVVGIGAATSPGRRLLGELLLTSLLLHELALISAELVVRVLVAARGVLASAHGSVHARAAVETVGVQVLRRIGGVVEGLSVLLVLRLVLLGLGVLLAGVGAHDELESVVAGVAEGVGTRGERHHLAVVQEVQAHLHRLRLLRFADALQLVAERLLVLGNEEVRQGLLQHVCRCHPKQAAHPLVHERHQAVLVVPGHELAVGGGDQVCGRAAHLDPGDGYQVEGSGCSGLHLVHAGASLSWLGGGRPSLRVAGHVHHRVAGPAQVLAGVSGRLQTGAAAEARLRRRPVVGVGAVRVDERPLGAHAGAGVAQTHSAHEAASAADVVAD